MYAHEIIAWVVEGDVFCTGCVPDVGEAEPIFVDGYNFDEPETCPDCGIQILEP